VVQVKNPEFHALGLVLGYETRIPPSWSPTAPSPGRTTEVTPSAEHLQTRRKPRRARVGRRSKHPEEFRQRAAQLVLDSRRPVREVAAELGVNHETLRNWVAAERRQRAEGSAALGADERLELARLRRKVAELELEREILKKAAPDSTGRRNTSLCCQE
jgi:transposase